MVEVISALTTNTNSALEVSVAVVDLDAMIVVVGDIDITRCINRYIIWIIQVCVVVAGDARLANSCYITHTSDITVEYLNSMIVTVSHIELAILIQRNTMYIVELIIAGALTKASQSAN